MPVINKETYCKLEDKTAIIKYGSATNPLKTIQIKDTPVTVTTGYKIIETPINVPFGDMCVAYVVSVELLYVAFQYYDDIRTINAAFYGFITDVYVDNSQWNLENNYRVTYYVDSHGINGTQECVNYVVKQSIHSTPNTLKPGQIYSVNIYPVDPNYVSPNPPYSTSKKVYYITFDKEDTNIYYDESDTEFIYNVSCDGCPPGTIKCLSTNYPGYCCLPCEPTKQSIIEIKNIVKSINKESVYRG